METVETWLFDLLMFAQGKAQPDVSDDVNRFYSPPKPPPASLSNFKRVGVVPAL